MIKTDEQLRMEEFYNANFPVEFKHLLNWEIGSNGQYVIGFAKLAWAAWQASKEVK